MQARTYRSMLHTDLVQHSLIVGETDLALQLPAGVWTEAVAAAASARLIEQRTLLQRYISEFPIFASSHQPLDLAPGAPPIVRRMAEAAILAGVGPMAAVAGALAAEVGEVLSAYAEDVIVENGGDIWLCSRLPRVIGLVAGGNSRFSGRVGVKIAPDAMPCGVCTSSGTLGSSFSYGRADAAMVIAENAVLADAAATAVANRVQVPDDVAEACAFALSIAGVRGALVCCGEQMGLEGEVELTAI